MAPREMAYEFVSPAEAASRAGVPVELVHDWARRQLVTTRQFPGSPELSVNSDDVNRIIRQSVTPAKGLQAIGVVDSRQAEAFMAEATFKAPATIPVADLYATYKAWSADRGEVPVSKVKFGFILNGLGYERRAVYGVSCRVGVSFKPGFAPVKA